MDNKNKDAALDILVLLVCLCGLLYALKMLNY